MTAHSDNRVGILAPPAVKNSNVNLSGGWLFTWRRFIHCFSYADSARYYEGPLTRLVMREKLKISGWPSWEKRNKQPPTYPTNENSPGLLCYTLLLFWNTTYRASFTAFQRHYLLKCLRREMPWTGPRPYSQNDSRISLAKQFLPQRTVKHSHRVHWASLLSSSPQYTQPTDYAV